MKRRMNSKRKGTEKRGFKKLITGAIAVAVAVTLGVTMLPSDALAATADLDTSTKYSESLGDNASTEYAGRIWTDKSVYSEDAEFELYAKEGETHPTATVTLDAENGEDFLVAFSALATSQSVSGKTEAPIDVVFVIDISGSMSNNESNMDNGYSRIYNTAQAVNDSIEKLMEMNAYTRVGVVAFSNTYQELLPLGRYEQIDANTEYFTLSKKTAAEYGDGGRNPQLEDIFLYTNAKIEGATGDGSSISKTTEVVGGTNIQMGLYGGLNMLATEDELYAQIANSQVKRIPSLILLSDGSPTYSSSSDNWWAPANNNGDGPGNYPYVGNGMKALMTGAYMKQQVNLHYGVTGTASETSIYTVGMGITNLPNYETDNKGRRYYTGEQDLANITLNPEDYWTEDNNMANGVENAWNTYILANNNRPSVAVNNGNNYTFSHPQANDINADADALKNLVTEYYAADSASSVTSVFEEIVSNITINVLSVPTELDGTLPVTQDGYITYTDPIGEYMEVKDVKTILYAGREFTLAEDYEPVFDAATKTTTYVFEGTVESAVYGNQDIRHVLITVTEKDGMETLVVKVPASVIPVRVNTVQLNEDGSVLNHENNGAYPIRVIYSVGLKDGILDAETDSLNTEAISAEYLKANMNSDGTVNFYSNLYSGKEITHIHADDGSEQVTTVGDATVEFEPSHSNPFYYMQEDVPIYTDKAGTVQATGTLDDDTTYYYFMDYYHGTKVEKEVVARTGKQLKRTEIITKDGKLYRKAGSPRLNRIMEFEGTKKENATNTANNFYLPTFEYPEGSTDPYDGKYVIYLGNNGVVSYAATGSLEITKEVVIPEGFTGPTDQSFTYTVNFNGSAALSGTFDYVITDAEGAQVHTGTIADGGTFSLTDGQTITIKNLPHNTTYEVTETELPGFTEYVYDDAEDVQAYVAGNTVTGSIQAGTAVSENYKNEYAATPVTYPVAGGLGGTKVLDGRDWMQGETYKFSLHAYNDAPLPGNPETHIVTLEVGIDDVVADNVSDQDTATFDFGTITYTKEGIYRYTVYENEPEVSNPGMTYSRALYRIVVEVVDNGEGALVVKSSDIQKLYTDDATRLFTYDSNNEIVLNQGQEGQDEIVFENKYTAGSITRTPIATKAYTDLSGNNPLVSGMFKFQFEAIGYYDGENLVKDTSAVPMPEGYEGSVVVTENEGHNVTFPSIVYEDGDIPAGKDAVTYLYKFSEVMPEAATADNGYTANGMIYDTTEYFVKVTITNDGSSHLVFVSEYFTGTLDALVPVTDDNVARFANTYDPTDAVAMIEGTKTLNGRDMKDGETFEFILRPVSDNAKEVLPTEVKTTVAGGEDGKAVPFDFSITLSKTGEYTFELSETKGTAGGVTYAENVSAITVTVTDNNGVLEAKVVYDNDTTKQNAAFVNTYTATFDDSAAVSLEATKNLTGRTIKNGEFFFEVAPENDAPMGRYAAIPVPGGADVYTSTVKVLDSVVYTEVGTYTYLITEQVPTGAELVDGKYVLHGVTYDPTEYRFTVEVEDKDQNGVLTVKSTKLEKRTGEDAWTAADAVEFNNAYEAKAATHISPILQKKLEGDRAEALKAGEFQFEMNVVSANPQDGVVLPSPATASNDADGLVKFADDITFTKAGDYVLAIKEVIPGGTENGPITYSDNVLEATVKVTDDELGQLHVFVTGVTGSYTFVNTYNTTGTFDFDIHKTIKDRAWEAEDAFAFEIIVRDQATELAVEAGDIVFPTKDGAITQVVITDETKDHTVTYPAITVNKPGTYSFEVREVVGTIPGMNYDGTSRTVTVTATDKGDGTLDVSYTVEGTTFNNDGQTLEFVNIYDTTSVELSGHESLRVIKNFTGREDDVWYEGSVADQFTFLLSAYDDETVAAVANNEVELPTDCSLTIDNTNRFYAHFGNIIFHEAGTYKFLIKEELPAGAVEVADGVWQKDGITYDTAEYVATITVVDQKSILEIASVTYAKLQGGTSTDASAMEFYNEYSVKEVELDGAAYLEVTKVLEGRKWTSDDAFTFILVAGNDVTEAAINAEEPTIILPKNASGLVMTKADNGVAHFDNIVFKEAGTYQFLIKEVNAGLKGISYDMHNALVTVTVTDDKAGNLVTAVPTDKTTLTFTNTYTPDPVPVVLKGEKVLEGRSLTADDKFSFQIEAETQGAPMPAATTVVNAADGSVSFGAMQFTEEGTYEYLISEKTGDIPGITYDKTPVKAVVKITNNEDKGVLEASVTYKKGVKTLDDGFVFTNEYNTQQTDEVTISAAKKVTASDGNTYALAKDDFSFGIEPAEANPADDPISHAIVTNAADGSVLFAKGTYKQEGTYVYTVHEVSGEKAGIIYDDSVYTVTVKVTDNTSNAKLVADVTITKDGKTVDAITFNNTYDPTVATAIVHGHKHLLGGHRDLADGEFTFTLTATNDSAKAVTPEPLTVKNTATGLVQFDELVFESVGTYTYVMSEKAGSLAGVTYDTTQHEVVIEVTDANGVLMADITIDGKHYGDVDELGVFKNTYVPASVSTDLIGGSKKLEGRPMEDGEFQFALVDGDGAEVKTAVNTDGKFHFDDVAFEKAGEYHFTIVEKDTELGGVSYDLETVYDVTVKVADKGGKLEVTDIAYVKANAKVTEVVFNNSYKAEKDAVIQLGAAKTIAGRALEEGEFTFVLTSEDGTNMTAVNGADGSILFDEITYTAPGTYVYTVTEETGTLEYVTYDDSIYTVTVEVTDDLKGSLSAEVKAITVEKDGTAETVEAVVFANIYEAPEVPEEPVIPEEPEEPVVPEKPEKPEGESPKTGDSMRHLGVLAVILVAGIGVYGASVRRKRA